MMETIFINMVQMRLKEIFLNNKLKSCVILSSLFMILFVSINSHAQHTSVDLESNRFARPIQPPIEPESINFLGLTLGRQAFIPDCTQEGMLSSDAPCAEVQPNNFKPVYPIKYAFNSLINVRMPDLSWVDQSLAQGTSLIYGTNQYRRILYLELSPRDIYAQEFMTQVISLLGEPEFSELMTLDNQHEAPERIRQYLRWLKIEGEEKISFNVWEDLSVGGTFYFWFNSSIWAHYISSSKTHSGNGRFVIYCKTKDCFSWLNNRKQEFIYTAEQNRFARPIQPSVAPGLSFFGITMGKPVTTIPECRSHDYIPCVQVKPSISSAFDRYETHYLVSDGFVYLPDLKWIDNTLSVHDDLRVGLDEEYNVVYLSFAMENQFKEALTNYVTGFLGESVTQMSSNEETRMPDESSGITVIQWRTHDVTADYTFPTEYDPDKGIFTIYLNRIVPEGSQSSRRFAR